MSEAAHAPPASVECPEVEQIATLLRPLVADPLSGPLLAMMLQATFLVTERMHERRRARAMPAASRRPSSEAKGRQFFYWVRRLGLAVATLGRFFTRQLMIQSDHRLVTGGLYRHVRHPAYTGTLLCNCGVGLVTLDWISGPVIIGATVALLRQRIRIEEGLMIEAFGEEYEKYRGSRARLVPLIY